MDKVGFVFFVATLLLTQIVVGLQISFEVQCLVAGVAIVGLGIPHGALDHILFLQNHRMPTWLFYLQYLVVMCACMLIWVAFPVIALILFLIVSAIHFGQAQFSEMQLDSELLKTTLSTFWGISMIAAIFFYNYSDIILLLQGIDELQPMTTILSFKTCGLLTGLSLSVTSILLLTIAFREQHWGAFFREIFLLLTIHLAFYLLPYLIAFTLFFVIVHSVRVLGQEYRVMSALLGRQSTFAFVRKLLPNTVVSIGFGLLFLLANSYVGWFSTSFVLIGLVAVATVPHAWVMDDFYKRRSA